MAKVQIQAGATIDTLNRHELADALAAHLTSWRHENARGIKARRFSAFGDATAGGVLTLGATGDQQIGPPEGFVWNVLRLSVSNYDPATATIALYHSSVSDSAVIHPDLAVYNTLDEIVYAGETLVLSGTGLAASARVWATGLVWEAPQSLAWKLL